MINKCLYCLFINYQTINERKIPCQCIAYFSTNSLSCRETSATTHVVLGQFKTCVILLAGFLLFGSNPGVTSILGAITALVGMSIYTYLNLKSKQQAVRTPTRQSPLSSQKLKQDRGNGTTQNGSLGDESV